MSSEINLRDDTKKLVLSILISAPRGRTVRELCSDFLEYMGYPIPFKEMGYLSVNEYFETNKDAFQLTWVKGELVVRGIADDSTEHIQRMVSRQRTPAKKSRVAAKKQTRNMMNKAGNHNAPSVSPFVRKCINELLLAYPDGILQTNFMAAYSRRFGQQLLFQKLGFASLRDLLKSLTNMLELVPLNNSGAYRVNLKKRSPSSSDKKMAASSSKRSVHGNNRSQQNGALTGPVSDGPNAGQVCNSSYTGPVSNSLRTGQVSNGPRAGPISNSSRMGPVSNSPATTKLPEDQNRNSSGTLHHSFKLSPHIPEEIQLNITKVLKKFQFGLCSNRMLREYKKINGQELPLAATGHVSVVEFLSELPHLVVITRPTKNGDWLLFEPEFYSQLENENAVDSAVRSTQQLDWRSIMKTIADRYPEGMPLRLLPDRFKAEVGVDLIPCDHQFTNLEDMIRSIDGKFVTIEQNNRSVVIYPLSFKPSNKSNPVLLDLDKIDVQAIPMNYREGIPPDCVGVNVRYTVQRIPQSYIGTENYFDVYVSQVDSPGRLYIQLKATTTTDALEDLMDDLEAIYWGPEGVEYQMPDFMFQVGQVCAAVFPQDNNWHRCCITKVLPNSDVVEVYFVDYGNRCCVKRDKCRLLKSKFIALPAQAIQAKLANIIPANGHKWTRSSQERVLSLVSNKCILAMVLGVENRVCNVCLCDTCTTEEDIHVNDVLCYEGFAMFVTDDIPDEREFDLESTPPSSVSGHDEVDAGNHPEKTRPTLRQLSSLLTAPPEAKPQQEYPFTSPSQSHTGSFETGANSFESEEEDEYIRYVLETKIGNFGLVHVINYGGTAYVHSSQISSYLWENDCLKTRLRQKRLVVPKVMVSLEDDPELFDEFDYYKVKGTVNAEGKCTDIATLYELKSLPRILQAFNYPDPKLIDIFKELYDQFDPDDPYWQGADEESEGDKSIDPKLEDLERTLRLLQFRKKLLSRQIDVGIPDAKDEENLKEVEQLISDMTKSIAQMKAGENGPTSQIKQSSQKNNSVNSQSKVVSPAVTSSGAMQPRLSAAAVDAHEINQALTHMNLNQHRNTYQQQQLPIHYQNQPVNNMMMPNHPPGFGLSHLPAQQPPPVMQLGRGTPIGAQQHVLAAHHQLSGMNISPYATTVPTVQAPFGRGQLLVNNMAAVNNGAYNHVLMPPGASMTTQQQQRQNAAQFYSGFQLVAKPTTMNPYAPSFHPGQSKT